MKFLKVLSNFSSFSILSPIYREKKLFFTYLFKYILQQTLYSFSILFKYIYFILLSYLNTIFFIHSLSSLYSFIVEREKGNYFLM